MGQDLVVDYGLLESSKSNLQNIKKAMDDVEDHSEDLRDIWGHDGLADKMDEFATNWDHYREELLNNVKELGGRVEDTLKNFQKQDHDLKNASQKRGGSK